MARITNELKAVDLITIKPAERIQTSLKTLYTHLLNVCSVYVFITQNNVFAWVK